VSAYLNRDQRRAEEQAAAADVETLRAEVQRLKKNELVLRQLLEQYAGRLAWAEAVLLMSGALVVEADEDDGD